MNTFLGAVKGSTKQIINVNSQFYKDLIDEKKGINVNNRFMSRGYYNLVVSIRDLGLYAIGLKPNRNWKISDVKSYFGIKGTTQSMLKELKEIRDAVKDLK